MKGYVYLIENKVNNKKYVGKTYLSVEERWKQHCKDAVRTRMEHRPLYEAIRKYGIDNFTISELEYCDNCEEREKYWIAHYNSYHEGYNATLGGDGKAYFEHSDQEVIDKYNELKSVIGVAEFFHCDKDTISIRLKNNNIVVPLGGDIYNEKKNWKAKKVLQLTLQGEIIQEFDSMKQAAEWLIENNYTSGQIKHIVSNISKTIRGIENRKQAYGFIWKSNMEG